MLPRFISSFPEVDEVAGDINAAYFDTTNNNGQESTQPSIFPSVQQEVPHASNFAYNFDAVLPVQSPLTLTLPRGPDDAENRFGNNCLKQEKPCQFDLPLTRRPDQDERKARNAQRREQDRMVRGGLKAAETRLDNALKNASMKKPGSKIERLQYAADCIERLTAENKKKRLWELEYYYKRHENYTGHNFQVEHKSGVPNMFQPPEQNIEVRVKQEQEDHGSAEFSKLFEKNLRLNDDLPLLSNKSSDLQGRSTSATTPPSVSIQTTEVPK